MKDEDQRPAEELPGIQIKMKDAADVLLKDIGGRIKQDGRWPVVLDVSKRAAMFLRYRDVNYLNACSSHDMSPDILRKALLGSIRYGKPLVVDTMDVDPVSYTHLRAHETPEHLVCRLLLEKKKKTYSYTHQPTHTTILNILSLLLLDKKNITI
eukprot:TRINITY_DN51955_c0_g1_i1.p1 TRINITY_DN51955_c0_g1~~TRINITY_DN51955_c0_g1_i1.p1  ORF type:complete len:154 (-),score=34.35 TRINITY_DN51955_c0_g1_i1:25-486(-)